jgi:Holliday junction resolvase-like predicted endonuclease
MSSCPTCMLGEPLHWHDEIASELVSCPVPNFYDPYFRQQLTAQASLHAAAEATASAYLDGKPKLRGKYKVTSAERDADFWFSPFLEELPSEVWRSDLMTLALARYFAQERVANVDLLTRIVTDSPGVLCNAVRHAGLVLCQHSPRRADLDQIAGAHPEIAELCKVLDIFELAHHERLAAVEYARSTLRALTPFDLLIHASLHVFEHILPHSLAPSPRSDGAASADEVAWHAINDILLWKLATAPENALKLREAEIGRSLGEHLAPLLSPSSAAQSFIAQEMRAAFGALLEAQIELNEFISRSADAFSYDDGIRFVRHGAVLKIEDTDPVPRAAWSRDSRKLARLHEYWFYRALDEFAGSKIATRTIGRPENHEANRLAYIRAMRTRLQLLEVYGVADTVTTDAGDSVDLFQALLSLELMSAFFFHDVIGEYVKHLQDSENWVAALEKLIVGGLGQTLENRLPLTWSDRDTKISRITGWTVSPETPQGSPRMAARILDFWTSDWASLAAQMRNSQAGLRPELFERPILKFGQCLVQLPWLVGMQNNSTAAINNLRRLGARRGEAREETQRIEERLGKALEARSFRVVLNWHPPTETHGNAGEVDLICARDGVVFVIEVKSTFIRKSQRDAWLHATTTLRRAGQQLQRKVAAVLEAFVQGSELANCFGLELSGGAPPIHGWIVDTSIERDHQRFSGFLKFSLEELLIALRDDGHLLTDPEGLFDATEAQKVSEHASAKEHPPLSLYPFGFSAVSVQSNHLECLLGA